MDIQQIIDGLIGKYDLVFPAKDAKLKEEYPELSELFQQYEREYYLLYRARVILNSPKLSLLAVADEKIRRIVDLGMNLRINAAGSALYLALNEIDSQIRQLSNGELHIHHPRFTLRINGLYHQLEKEVQSFFNVLPERTTQEDLTAFLPKQKK